MKKSLKERTKQFSTSLGFMENRKKADQKELVGQIVTIRDYGFLTGDNGEYVAFIVDEHSDKFYFGGGVLTDQLRQLEEEDYHEEIVTEGLPMVLVERKSRNNRTYLNVTFYPEMEV